MAAPLQIFAHTAPANEFGEGFVRFAQLFLREDGAVILTTRNGAGMVTEIGLPAAAQDELAAALKTAKLARPKPEKRLKTTPARGGADALPRQR